MEVLLDAPKVVSMVLMMDDTLVVVKEAMLVALTVDSTVPQSVARSVVLSE